MKKCKAFTLIELLVVISIIALLLSILMPALSKVKEQGRMLVCRSNLKGITLGALLWSQDNDDWAIAGDWYKAVGENETESSIGPYLGSRDGAKGENGDIFVCPSSKKADFFHVDDDYETDERKFTYASNGYITFNMSPYGEGSPGQKGPSTGSIYGQKNVYWTEHGVTKMSAIRMSTETVYFLDHEYYSAFSWTFDPHKELKDFPEKYRYATRWHKKKAGEDYGVANIAWVDGHVTVEPKDFTDISGTESNPRYKWKYYFYDH